MNYTESSPREVQSYTHKMIVNAGRLVFGIFALIGNGFILFLLAKNNSLRRTLCNLLIGLLAVADFTTGVGLVIGAGIQVILQIVDWNEYTRRDCIMLNYIGMVGIQMSQIATIFIAFDRLRAVRCPLQYSLQDQNRNRKAIVSALFTIIFAMISTAAMFFGVDLNDHPELCTVGGTVKKIFAIYWYIFSASVAVIVLYCYISTSLVMRKKIAHANFSQAYVQNRILSRHAEVFKTISIVLFVYAVCWCLPNFILVVLSITTEFNQAILGKISPIVALGVGIHSSTNVLIYAWKHHEFRSAMRQFFTGSSSVPTRLFFYSSQQQSTSF